MYQRSEEAEVLYNKIGRENNQETQTAENKFHKAFPAFKNPNFRIYFIGQFISQTGTWIQTVAHGWLVFKLTDSTFTIGLLAAFSCLPMLLFMLPGGLVVDRYSKKNLLLATQFLSMLLAFALAGITHAGFINLGIIAFTGFLAGLVNAVDSPAKQAFVSEIVSKDQLASAISLTSVIFNVSRIVGPIIAGILIMNTGAEGAFVTNGLSYLAVLIAIYLVKARFPQPKATDKLNAISEIWKGLNFSFRHPLIRLLMLFTGLLNTFGWSYTILLPVIANQTFHSGVQGLSYMYVAIGLGAIGACCIIGIFSKRISPLTVIYIGSMLFSSSLAAFSFMTSIYPALLSLFFAGMGLLLQSAVTNSLIQNQTHKYLKGRVLSIYLLMQFGLSAVGNFQIGFVSEYLGTAIAIRIGALILAVTLLILPFVYRSKASLLRFIPSSMMSAPKKEKLTLKRN